VLLAALCAAATGLLRRGGAALAIGALAGALVVGQVGAWAHHMMLGIGASTPEAMAPLAFLTALALCPLLLAAAPGRAGRWSGAAALVVGVGLMLWLRLAPPADFPVPERPGAAAEAA
jgi:hypothetical protein